jgi:hypothetical protein
MVNPATTATSAPIPKLTLCPQYACSPVIGRGPAPCYSPICGQNTVQLPSARPNVPVKPSVPITPPVTPPSTDIVVGGFDLTAFVSAVPWWGWAIGAGGIILLMSSGGQSRGRR